MGRSAEVKERKRGKGLHFLLPNRERALGPTPDPACDKNILGECRGRLQRFPDNYLFVLILCGLALLSCMFLLIYIPFMPLRVSVDIVGVHLGRPQGLPRAEVKVFGWRLAVPG